MACQNTAYLVPGCPTPSGVWCSCVGPQPEKKTLTWWSTPSAVQNATSPAATGPWPLTLSVSPGSSRRPSYSLWESTANYSACLSSIGWLKGWYQCCLPVNFWLQKNLVDSFKPDNKMAMSQPTPLVATQGTMIGPVDVIPRCCSGQL